MDRGPAVRNERVPSEGGGGRDPDAAGSELTPEQFFAGRDPAAPVIFAAVRAAVEAAGPCDVRVTKSQIAFRRRTNFAFVWQPAMYLRRAAVPLVLTVGLHRRDPSPRWKEVVEPAPYRYTHHLELRSPEEVDDEVRAWLREAWELAG